MDSFEEVIASILQRQGYWTLTSAKVELTKAEKRAIGRPSNARWELDVVAYSGGRHELLFVECKSYLDSTGVDCAVFTGGRQSTRYKLFCEPTLRDIVLKIAERQFVNAGFCAPNPTTQLCLAAGKIKGSEDELRAHFQANGWRLFGPEEIRSQLRLLKDSGYENSVASVVAKLLLRDGRKTTP